MVALLVVLTVLAFLAVEALRCRLAEGSAPSEAASPLALPIPGALTPETVSVPEGLFLDAGHTWLALHPSGLATIGVDSFVGKALGSPESLRLPTAGAELRRGDPLVALKLPGRSLTLRAPVDGTVTSVNAGLPRDADALSQDPYSRGWVCTLRPARLARALGKLRVAEDASAWLRGELERLREFLATRSTGAAVLGATRPDGGLPAEGALRSLDQEAWDRFAEAFLGTEAGPD